jgi:hypothetical protein
MTTLNPSLGSRPSRPAGNAALRKVRKIFIHQVFSARWPLGQRIGFYCALKVKDFISPSWSTKVKVI